MKSNLTKFALSAGIMLAMAFTFSCSSDDGNNNGGGGGGGGIPFTENSQVYNRDGSPFTGSGVIKIRDNSINIGSVTNGKVNLQLPSTIPDDLLMDFVSESERQFCTEYPNDIKFFSASRLILTNSGNADKQMLIIDPSSSNNTEDPRNSNLIYYYFFSKDGKITCDAGGLKININAKKGWNTIYRVADNINDINAADKYSTDNILTKEVKWFIS